MKMGLGVSVRWNPPQTGRAYGFHGLRLRSVSGFSFGIGGALDSGCNLWGGLGVQAVEWV